MQTKTASLPEKAVDIAFPDGTTIHVTLKPVVVPWSGVQMPERLADAYADLKQRAEGGDAPAARTLYQWLSRCDRAFEDEASFNAAVERLHTERVLMSPNASGPRRLPAGADVAEWERLELRQPYEFCKGITAGQKAEAGSWLQLAARAGDYIALQRWAQSLGDTPEGLAALEDLWNRGFSSVLSALAIRNSRGILSAAPDHVRAYAYSFINFKLLEAAYEGSSSPTRRMMLMAVEDSLRYRGGLLTPQETQRAIELAAQLLAENPNCCTGSW